MLPPQDQFNYSFSGICCGTITVATWYFAARYWGDEEESDRFSLIKKALYGICLGGVVAYPGWYAFFANQHAFTSVASLIPGLTLASGSMLTIILWGLLFASQFGKGLDDKQKKYAVKDINVLGAGVQGDLAGSIHGWAPGIKLPFSWIFAHMLYITSAGIMIYLDNTKPFVFTFVTCVVPLLLAMYCHQLHSYLAWHTIMAAYWILTCVSSASMTGPQGTQFAPVATSFVATDNQTYWNLTLNVNTTQSEFFLTGPSPSMMANMLTTIALIIYSQFIVAVGCFLFNLMKYEPDPSSHLADEDKGR
jgi:hypothetical protein